MYKITKKTSFMLILIFLLTGCLNQKSNIELDTYFIRSKANIIDIKGDIYGIKEGGLEKFWLYKDDLKELNVYEENSYINKLYLSLIKNKSEPELKLVYPNIKTESLKRNIKNELKEFMKLYIENMKKTAKKEKENAEANISKEKNKIEIFKKEIEQLENSLELILIDIEKIENEKQKITEEYQSSANQLVKNNWNKDTSEMQSSLEQLTEKWHKNLNKLQASLENLKTKIEENKNKINKKNNYIYYTKQRLNDAKNDLENSKINYNKSFASIKKEEYLNFKNKNNGHLKTEFPKSLKNDILKYKNIIRNDLESMFVKKSQLNFNKENESATFNLLLKNLEGYVITSDFILEVNGIRENFGIIAIKELSESVDKDPENNVIKINNKNIVKVKNEIDDSNVYDLIFNKIEN